VSLRESTLPKIEEGKNGLGSMLCAPLHDNMSRIKRHNPETPFPHAGFLWGRVPTETPPHLKSDILEFFIENDQNMGKYIFDV